MITGFRGSGRFFAPRSGGRGRQLGGFGLGPDEECVCPRCGTKATHPLGAPCYQIKCPKCGAKMTRIT